MINKHAGLYLLAALVMLCSCGTSKKTLEVVQAEVAGLKTKNAELEKTVTSLNSNVSSLEAKNKSLDDALTGTKAECLVTQKKLAFASALLQEQYDNMQAVKSKIETVLTDFASKGASVYYKNGYVYVTMEDDLLYKSGSAKLGEDGKKALSSLAGVLNDYPNLKIVVLGNTDDVMFKKGSDNWSLSTERANGIVRLLRDDYKMDPTRLTSAGKGKYNPIADNTSAAGRSKNRRTDIILNPDLDKLWNSATSGN